MDYPKHESGRNSSDADIKMYPEYQVAGETYDSDYLKYVDGKNKSDVAKVKRSMIKHSSK